MQLKPAWPPVTWKRRIAMLLAAMILFMGVCEGVLHAFFRPHLSQIYRLDEDLLYSPIPGAQRYFSHSAQNGGERVLVSINSKGFRGEDDLAGSPSGKMLRIAVFGDSCVMAEFSPENETFVYQLGRNLEAGTGRSVKSINAGAVGYGPDQELLRMQKLLPELELDLAVVVAFADNDLGDLVRNKLFRLDNLGRLERQSPVLSEPLRRRFNPGLSASLTFRASKRLWRTLRSTIDNPPSTASGSHEASAVLDGRIEIELETSRSEFADFLDGGEVLSFFADHYDWDASFAPACRSAVYKSRLLAAVFGEMRTVAKATGTPLFIVILPSRADVCESSIMEKAGEAGYGAYQRFGLSRIFAAAAEKHGIPYLSLFQSYSSRGVCDYYFKPPDNHWNAAGQLVAAREVSKAILSSGIVP